MEVIFNRGSIMKKSTLFLPLIFFAQTTLPKFRFSALKQQFFGRFTQKITQLRNRFTILPNNFVIPKRNSGQRKFHQQFSTENDLHQKACDIYAQEIRQELTNPTSYKVKWNDFAEKTALKIQNLLREDMKKDFLNNGTPVEQATNIDTKNVLLQMQTDPKVEQSIKQINKKIKGKGFYQDFLDCVQQPDTTLCRKKNKERIRGVAKELYEKYYETDRGTLISSLNYTYKPKPLWFGKAATYVFHPDNLKKIDQEL